MAEVAEVPPEGELPAAEDPSAEEPAVDLPAQDPLPDGGADEMMPAEEGAEALPEEGTAGSDAEGAQPYALLRWFKMTLSIKH